MTTTTAARPATACDPAVRITKSLLGYGVIAGPIYVGVSLAQALTRPGFSLARHPWSLLENGGLGWIQITNFLVTGLMVIAFAVGVGRTTGSRWAARLITAFGAGLVLAGVFRADPADGFPVGTPAGPGQVSWHGVVHLVVAGIGFGCVFAACLVLAGRLRRSVARYTRISGAVFLASFVAIAAGAGAAWSILTFIGGLLVIFAWMSALAVHLYRHADR
jgi:hypothetical protein